MWQEINFFFPASKNYYDNSSGMHTHDRWMGEWMDGWMDGRMDGRMDR